MFEYTRICAICGIKFKGVGMHSRKYCSPSCRKIATKGYYKSVGKKCVVCGVALPDGRQEFCFECLLKDYYKTHSTISYNRLRNRGYDKEMIKEELKNRGIL